MGERRKRVEISKAVVETFAPALSIIGSMPKKIRAILDAHRQEFDRRYDEYYPAMKAYIESKGLPLPSNRDEMYTFFIKDSVNKGLYDKLDENLKKTDLLTYAVSAKLSFDNFIANIVEENDNSEIKAIESNSNSYKINRKLYGQHQDNRDWVASIYSEAELNGLNQGETIKMIQMKYQERFNLKISRTTVLRYAGKTD